MQKTLFTRIRIESYVFALALIATTVLFAQTAFAQNGGGTPSSKATAAINTAVGCTFSQASNIGDAAPQTCTDIFTGTAVPVTADNFATVMTSTIKVSNSQSLFVSPSLVTGLYTQTKTRTQVGSTSTATGSGGVYLRAIVTNLATSEVQVGEPVNSCVAGILGCGTFDGKSYGVTLNTRVQTLTQEISACVAVVGGITGTCDFTSTIDLILKTTSAHTFNFIFPNVGVGTYKVEIQAAVNSGAFIGGSGTATGAAAYGLGSLTVESVRLVHDFQF